MLMMNNKRVTINITEGEYNFFKAHPELSLSAIARRNLEMIIIKYQKFERELEEEKKHE